MLFALKINKSFENIYYEDCIKGYRRGRNICKHE